jgi:uncharacterized membrane protein YdcZ (DUF606 family)
MKKSRQTPSTPTTGRRGAGSPQNGERPRYPLLGQGFSRAQWASALIALAAGVGLAYLYIRSSQSADFSPDSKYGYGFAIAGTSLLLLVGLGYPLRKRLGRRWPGRLHTFMAWHMTGGILGLLIILMHAAGNFNPRSGTYALYGLIGIVISGFIGRAIDRFAPRQATKAALDALGASGEERLDELEEELDELAGDVRAQRDALSQPEAQGTPWDLAYYDLDPQIDDIPALLSQGVRNDTGPILDLTQISAPLVAQPSQRLPRLSASERLQSTGEVARQAGEVQRALGREKFYLSLVRVWRHVHTLISLVTLGLVIWHLEYAATLLLNAMKK